jgi:hypothetical protein
MLMNHFLGRLSYNVNKLTDMLDSLLTALSSSLDSAGGIASVDSNGKVTLLNNIVNTGDSSTPAENGTDKFTTGGAYTLQQAVNGKAPTNHASSGTTYGVASATNYGHTKILAPVTYKTVSITTFSLREDVNYLGMIAVLAMGSYGLSIKNNLPFDISVMGIRMTSTGGASLRGLESVASGATSTEISFTQGDSALLWVIPKSSSVAGI